MANKIKWNEANFKWDDNPHLWNLVIEIIEAVDQGVGGGITEVVTALEPEKKKRLIRLVMRRKGIKMYDESKEVQNIEAHVDEVEMIVEEVKAKMLVENINV
jgi:hypothetical protein|tara:strand:- start:672 stop:977 length:306 start_codon:yes stop_codon:yes gene_type:complete